MITKIFTFVVFVEQSFTKKVEGKMCILPNGISQIKDRMKIPDD